MQNLLRALLLRKPAAPHNFSVESGEDESTVYLYDEIGEFWGGVGAEVFAASLAKIRAPLIHLRINSGGGDVFEARAMIAAMRAHQGRIVAHIDGLAASAASAIAMAADHVSMVRGSFLMIHEARTITYGTGQDMRDSGALLDKIDDALVADYAAKTNHEDAVIRAWMAAETWFSAEEALASRFIDEIEAGRPKSAAAWNLAAFKNPPADLLTDEGGDESKARDRAEQARLLYLGRKVKERK